MRYVPDLSRISEAVAESFGVRQVYGEPIERDGTIIVPAARVWSGGGAGGGGGIEPGAAGADASEPAADDPDAADSATTRKAPAEGGGGGLGFGRRAEPAGAFVVDDDGVRWVPAVDVNRIVLGGQVALVLVATVVGWAVLRRRG